MCFGISALAAARVVDRRARLAAGAAAASPAGNAEVPHLKHNTGPPFLSRKR
jgi:hypothetical protein